MPRPRFRHIFGHLPSVTPVATRSHDRFGVKNRAIPPDPAEPHLPPDMHCPPKQNNTHSHPVDPQHAFTVNASQIVHHIVSQHPTTHPTLSIRPGVISRVSTWSPSLVFCLFVCLFVVVKPEKLCSTSFSWRIVNPLGMIAHRLRYCYVRETKTPAQTTYLSVDD